MALQEEEYHQMMRDLEHLVRGPGQNRAQGQDLGQNRQNPGRDLVQVQEVVPGADLDLRQDQDQDRGRNLDLDPNLDPDPNHNRDPSLGPNPNLDLDPDLNLNPCPDQFPDRYQDQYRDQSQDPNQEALLINRNSKIFFIIKCIFHI